MENMAKVKLSTFTLYDTEVQLKNLIPKQLKDYFAIVTIYLKR